MPSASTGTFADRKLYITWAQSRLLDDRRTRGRLEARTYEADCAHRDACVARSDAELARRQADAATQADENAQQQIEALKWQIAELNAKASERSLAVTPGDLLCATRRADLGGGANSHLARLARFLNRHQ